MSGSKWDTEAVRRDPAAVMRAVEAAKHKDDKAASSDQAATAMEDSRDSNPATTAKNLESQLEPLNDAFEAPSKVKPAKTSILQHDVVSSSEESEGVGLTRPRRSPNTNSLVPEVDAQASKVKTVPETDILPVPASLRKPVQAKPDCYDSFGEVCAGLGVPDSVISPRRFMPRPSHSPGKNRIQRRDSLEEIEVAEPTRDDLEAAVNHDYGSDHRFKIWNGERDSRNSWQKLWDEHGLAIVVISSLMIFTFLLGCCCACGVCSKTRRHQKRERQQRDKDGRKARDRRRGGDVQLEDLGEV
ncbi:hypothetical protein MMC13_006904 [Lambiella insularis]|nr:hypothetical protein [Lambiella insularis]